MPEQKRTLRSVYATDVERLQQIVQLLSELNGVNEECRKHADDLYYRAMGRVLGCAPAPILEEWSKIEREHLRIQNENLKALLSNDLTSEEEKLYQRAIDS